MKIRSKTDGQCGKIPAGSTLAVTLEEGRHKTTLHSETMEMDLEYNTAFVARLDASECAELGLRSGIGLFLGKSAK